MHQFILDLTDKLIAENHYDDKLVSYTGRLDKFVKDVQGDLAQNDVYLMDKEMLARIMFGLDVGDVMTSKESLFKLVCWGGDGAGLLRELVAACLAYVIKDRLIYQPVADLPRYKRKTLGILEKHEEI
jgi:hypothetical protein